MLFRSTSTVALPPTFPFPLCLFTSPTTLYFAVTLPYIFHYLTLLLPIFLVHVYSYTSLNFSLPSLSLYLPHYSLLRRYTHFIIFHNLTLLLPILLVHAYGYTSSNLSLPSLPLYLPHYSLLHYYTSFSIFSLLRYQTFISR